jgi:competence protein ComEA
MDEKNRPPRTAWTILRRSDQACAAAVVAASLGLIAAVWIHQGGHRGRLLDIERAEPKSHRFQLDVNQADWPEWALLPGIGETLARRIVDSRRTEGPFRGHDDLLRVKGIGPRKLGDIRPYLSPMPRVPTRQPP